MKDRNKHIAAYIIGIFLFPILFQPWHMVQHHSEDQVPHSCDQHHHHAAEQAAQPGEKYQSSQEHCLICEYEFPINDLPSGMAVEEASLDFQAFHLLLASTPYQHQEHPQISPRAPPAA